MNTYSGSGTTWEFCLEEDLDTGGGGGDGCLYEGGRYVGSGGFGRVSITGASLSRSIVLFASSPSGRKSNDSKAR